LRRKEDYPLEKVTLNLRDGDFSRLRHLHGRLGAGKVVRELVIGHIKRVEEILAQKGHLSTSQLEEIEP
jgi:hypothetical protein